VLFHPELARAAADKLETISITLENGQEASAALALPEAETAPTVVLIHEWWGLNDQIKAVAAELANLGYIALAVDLYGGESATTAEGAKALMTQVDKDAATTTLVGWVDWLKNHERSTGKVATMGWCFGGGWSLNTSIATPVDATVIYYGNVKKSAEELKSLSGPVMGHFGEKDKNINQAMVEGFKEAMDEAGKSESLQVYWYDADHAFANPTSARYDEANAEQAWERTTAFLAEHLHEQAAADAEAA